MTEQEQRAYDYWQQYHWAIPLADAEERMFPRSEMDYKQFLPADPTHARAWIPDFVRYAKRAAVNFRCPISGWLETDWYRGIGGGPFRKVGSLTMDHIVPGAAGGLTTDENIRAMSFLANSKKGHKLLTDEELSRQIHSSYRIVEMPADLLEVLNKYGITQYRLG